MTKRGRLIVTAPARDLTQLDVLHRDGSEEGRQAAGADAGGCGPFLHRDKLDGTRHDRLELLVGLAPPLQPVCSDDEDVDLAVANCCFAGRQGGEEADTNRGAYGVALFLDGPGQPGGRRPGQPDVFGATAGDEARQHDDRRHAEDHQYDRDAKRGGLAPLAHLASRNEPRLSRAVHDATAWRNSSDRVGG